MSTKPISTLLLSAVALGGNLYGAEIARIRIPDGSVTKVVQSIDAAVDINSYIPLRFDGSRIMVRRNSGAMYIWKLDAAGLPTKTLVRSEPIDTTQILGFGGGKILYINSMTKAVYLAFLDGSGNRVYQKLSATIAVPRYSVLGFDGDTILVKNNVTKSLYCWFIDASAVVTKRRFIGTLADGQNVKGFANDIALLQASNGAITAWKGHPVNAILKVAIGSQSPTNWSLEGFDEGHIVFRNITTSLDTIQVWELNTNLTRKTSMNHGNVSGWVIPVPNGGLDSGYVGTNLIALKGFESQKLPVTIAGTVSDDGTLSKSVKVELYRNETRCALQITGDDGAFNMETAPFSDIQEYKVKVLGTP